MKNKRYIKKWIINIVLTAVAIIYLYPVGEMFYDNYQNYKSHKQSLIEKQELLNTKDMDWITVKNTKIDYPVAWKANDNFYYLSHDIYGNETQHGAIFYEGSVVPFSTHATILYGHCMRDKSMFATLHYLREDKAKFTTSEVTIERPNGEIRKYKPLGLYTTNSNFYYTKLSSMSFEDAIETIKNNSKYFISSAYKAVASAPDGLSVIAVNPFHATPA